MEINTNKTCAADTMKQQIENAQKATGVQSNKTEFYPFRCNVEHIAIMFFRQMIQYPLCFFS